VSEEFKNANYKLSTLSFLIMLIIALVFFMFYVFAENDVCVYIPEPYDLMSDFERWIPHETKREGAWDSGVDVPLNDEGYPRIVPFKSGLLDYEVKTILGGSGDILQDGSYKFSFKGSGQIGLGYDAQEKIYDKAGEYNVLVIGSGKGVYLEIVESDISDPIRDIHFYAPVQKELRSCEVSELEDNVVVDNDSVYIVVSESGLRNDDEDLNVYDLKWRDKFLTGLMTIFAILAIFYILK
jgi:hypothetical protein